MTARERGYCRRPANPSSPIGNPFPPPLAPDFSSIPLSLSLFNMDIYIYIPWLNRGENEIERRIFRGARRPPPDELSIGCPLGFNPYIGFVKGVLRKVAVQESLEKEGGSFLIFHRSESTRSRIIFEIYVPLRRFGFKCDFKLILIYYLSLVEWHRFFLAVFSRGKFARKEDGGRDAANEYISPASVLFDLQFESSRVEEVQVCVCVCSRASEREGDRIREKDESWRFHPTLLLGVKTQSPGSVYRGYTSKLIFVSPIPPSGNFRIPPNLGFSSIIRPFVRPMIFFSIFFYFFFYLFPLIVILRSILSTLSRYIINRKFKVKKIMLAH